MHYLDNSSTTRISRRALDKYIEVSENHFGNPSSLHNVGVDASHYLSDARRAVMQAIGARDGEVIFTGSGTEANNIAILGHAHAKERYARGKILISAGEHASVREAAIKLEKEGFTVVKIPTARGELDFDALEAALDKSVILVSVMLVNNETGAHYDIARVSRMVKRVAPDALMHTDAVQGFFKVDCDVRRLGVDMITVSAHKVAGPKGVGALWISRDVVRKRDIMPLIFGGGQESGYRSGTENVPAIAAFGEAILEGRETWQDGARHMAYLREKLIGELALNVPDIRVNDPARHAPHIINLTLPRIKSEVMLHYLSSKDICVSSGSACSSHSRHVSEALLSFGIGEADADCSIRVSLSRHNSDDDISALVYALGSGVRELARIL